MFEQDYIMRMIHDLIRILMKTIFQTEDENFSPYLIENPETREKAEDLLRLADSGNIRQAEAKLSDLIQDETALDTLLIGLTFYAHLSELDEKTLAEQHLTPETIQEHLKQLLSAYGLGAMADTFFFEI